MYMLYIQTDTDVPTLTTDTKIDSNANPHK